MTQTLLQDQKKKQQQKVEYQREQEGEGKGLCPKWKEYIREVANCEVCDRWMHYKCEEIMQQQVEEEYSDKIPYIRSTDRKKIEENITREQWKRK